MNNTKNILCIAAITSLLIMGATVVPMQSYAGESKNTKDSKSTIKASVGLDKKSASQHLDQDNFCYRGDEDCQQANEGQQIVGKDNEADGLNDQSRNLQQQAVSPTTAPTPTTGNGTTPTTATLNVCKVVVNRGSTSFQPSDFTFNFTTTANPNTFQGDNEGCTTVTVAPGTYTFTEIFPPSLLSISSPVRGDCSFVDFADRGFTFGGTIAAGETQTCAITNVVDR